MPAHGTQPGVDVVIVNFNAGEALARCAGSVLKQDACASLTVVDNASGDGSLEEVEQKYGVDPRLKLLRNPENRGFARAANQAAQQSAGARSQDYLLILNPDCEVDADALETLRGALEREPAAALAGPLVVDREGRPRRATLRHFPDPRGALLTFSGLWRLGRWWPAWRGVERSDELPGEIARAEAVSGACMLVRRSAFEAAGGLDEAYGMHCEDLDLMYRLRQMGGHCLFVPQARVVHLQGLSSRSRPLWVHWQRHRGMQRFFTKFQAERYRLPMRWLVLAGIWLRFLVTSPRALLRR
jgi:GT2 family glycosyltransferase